MRGNVIFLTATVDPGNVPFNKITNPNERRKQYLDSLNFWLRETDLRIVLVENSGHDLSQHIEESLRHRIEFLNFLGNDSARWSKGYGEMRCFDYASKHSRFFGDADFIYKVTGRLKILNFKKITRWVDRVGDGYVLVDLKDSLRFADSRFFVFRPAFIHEYLVHRERELNDQAGVYFEHVLAKTVLTAVIDGKKVYQFPFYPLFSGVAGTEGKKYKTGFFHNALKQVKYFLKERFVSGY